MMCLQSHYNQPGKDGITSQKNSLSTIALFFLLKAAATRIAREKGCKTTNSLMRLPEHNGIQQCIPDAMHTIKDCIEHVVKLICGEEDSLKVRKMEEALDRFPECWVKGSELPDNVIFLPVFLPPSSLLLFITWN